MRNKLKITLNILIFTLPVFFIIGCKSHYSYSSSPKKEITRVRTDIKELKLESLTGVSVHTRTYLWDFKKYLKEELKERTYIRLNSNSSNKLSIKASISPIQTKKTYDRVFKVDQFRIVKSIEMRCNYQLLNKDGKVIVSEPLYIISTENSAISNRSYKDAQRKYNRDEKRDKLYKKLMRSLAKGISIHIMRERELK